MCCLWNHTLGRLGEPAEEAEEPEGEGGNQEQDRAGGDAFLRELYLREEAQDRGADQEPEDEGAEWVQGHRADKFSVATADQRAADAAARTGDAGEGFQGAERGKPQQRLIVGVGRGH